MLFKISRMAISRYDCHEVMIMGRTEERILQSGYENVIGANMKQIRLSQGLKATELIHKLHEQGYDINTGSYWKIEAGVNNPSVHLLILFVELMGCDYNALFQKPAE